MKCINNILQVIQALGSSGIKGSAMVMAEDTDTGLLLRADVIVDKIHSLKIVTKTHELYLEETPEKFEVRAYDEHGNEFSTLKGLKFRWTIESGGNAAGTDILRFMTWKDSPYNTEPILFLRIFWGTLWVGRVSPPQVGLPS